MRSGQVPQAARLDQLLQRVKVAGDIVIAIAAENPESLTDIPDQVQKFADVPYCE